MPVSVFTVNCALKELCAEVLGWKPGDRGCSASTSQWPLSLTMRWPRTAAKRCSRIRCSRLQLAPSPEPWQPFCSTPLISLLEVAFGKSHPNLFRGPAGLWAAHVRRRALALGSPRGAEVRAGECDASAAPVSHATGVLRTVAESSPAPLLPTGRGRPDMNMYTHASTSPRSISCA